MMKALSMVLLSAVLFQSCIGSFELTKKVYNWNMGVGDKWVNELVFLVCSIVPVYAVAGFVDVIVLNSIEFWSDENPMAMKEGEKRQKLVEIDGKSYLLTSEKYKMTIEEKEANSHSKTELVFREDDNSWYLVKGKKLQKLVEVEIDGGEVTAYHIYNPDGTDLTVRPGFDPVALQSQLSGNRLAIR